MPTVDYNKRLQKDLKNVKYAAGYLAAAMEEGEDIFLLALREVAQAQGGIAQLARMTSLNRENLYDILSKKGNPRLKSIIGILDGLGLELTLRPKPRRPKAA